MVYFCFLLTFSLAFYPVQNPALAQTHFLRNGAAAGNPPFRKNRVDFSFSARVDLIGSLCMGGGSNTFFSQWHKKDTGQTFFPKNDPNLIGAKIIQIEPKLNKLIAFNFCSMSKNAFNWTNQKSITENMAIKIWFNAVQSRSIEPKKYIYRGSKISIKRPTWRHLREADYQRQRLHASDG